MSEQNALMPEDKQIIVNNLIIVKQLPVIQQKLQLMSDEIDAEVAKVKAMPVTTETVKTVKKARAALNAKFTELEERRKEVKKLIAEPYNKFNTIYDSLITKKFEAGLADIDAKTKEVEDDIKKQMEDVIIAFYTEYALAKNVAFLSFADSGIKVLLSSTEKQLKEECRAFIDTVAFDIDSLGTLDNGVEMVAEYKTNGFQSAKAIKTVNDRHAAIEKEKAQKAEREAVQKQQSETEAKVNAVMSAPIPANVFVGNLPDENEVLTVTFTVTATRKQIRVLREYMKGANIRYE